MRRPCNVGTALFWLNLTVLRDSVWLTGGRMSGGSRWQCATVALGGELDAIGVLDGRRASVLCGYRASLGGSTACLSVQFVLQTLMAL